MPIAVQCPGCSAKLNAPDAAAGKTVKCPKCKEPLAIPEAAAGPAFEVVDEPEPVQPKPVAKKKPAVEVDDEKPVVKKKKIVVEEDDEDDEEEERPRKKKSKKKPEKAGLSPVLIGTIAGGVLLLGGGAFAIYWFGIRESAPQTATSGTPSTPAYASGGFPNGPPGPGGPPGPNAGGPPNGGGNTAPPGKPLYEATNPQIAVYRQISNNNLRQIGLAVHNFASVYRDSIPAGIYDSSGNVGLSWRVAILPFIEQESLYRQFNLKEPWNSEQNKKLIPLMPKTYAAPGQDPKNGKTFYRSFTGPETAFPGGMGGAAGQPAFGVKIGAIPDGTSNTGFVAEAAEAVEWTKPDELVFSPSGPAPRLGGIFPDGWHLLLGDGSTRRMKASTPEATIKAIITAKGGEIVDFDN